MSEEQAVVTAVPDTTQPVAVDPALLNKPVMPEQSASGGADDAVLKHKLGLANGHTKAAEKRAKEAEAKLEKLATELESMKSAQLPPKSLWKNRDNSVNCGRTPRKR